MKKKIHLLVTFFFAVVLLYPKEIRLLTIGNSFSDDAVEHYLHGLVATEGDTIIIANANIGGSSLSKHYDNAQQDASAYSYRKIVDGVKSVTLNYKLSDAIIDEPWDYISFQQVSSYAGIYSSYFPYLADLLNYVKKLAFKRDIKFILHATWAYAKDSTHAGFARYNRNQQTMYEAIIDATSRAAKATGIQIIIPAVTAIQNGRTSMLGDTFCRDGYHLELTYGRYTASCVWYEALFGKSVIGNRFLPESMTACQALIAQLSAHYAVKRPHEVTPVAVCDAPVHVFAK